MIRSGSVDAFEAGPETAAVVDGQPITVADRDARLAAIRRAEGADNLPATGSPEQVRLRRLVVHALVDEALLAHTARSLGLVDEAPLAHTARSLGLVDEREAAPFGHLAAVVFEAVTVDVVVDDATVLAHHHRTVGAEPTPERRRLDSTVCPRRSMGVELAREAGRRGGLRVVAGPHRVHELDVVAGPGGGPLHRAAFAAEPGDVVGPVLDELGWIVAELRSVRPAAVPAVDLEALRAELQARARGRAFDRWLARERDRRAVFMPGHEHPGDPSVPGAVHRH